jgi:hypothetical protein
VLVQIDEGMGWGDVSGKRRGELLFFLRKEEVSLIWLKRGREALGLYRPMVELMSSMDSV